MTPISATPPPRRYERGGVSWVTLLLLVAVLGTAYLAVVWTPIYVVHYEVKQTVRDYMNQAVKNRDDEGLRDNLCAKLKVLDSTTVVGADGRPERIPSVVVAPSDVTWERDASASPPMLHVAFEYRRQVHYPFLERTSEWIGTIDLNNDLTIPDWGPAR
jgi:hypothetical protein